MSTNVTLWYFADPMCSWCWGFSPVLDKIKQNYEEKIKVALMLGGLRPGTTETISPETREEILHHWEAVQKMTGQEFNFNNPMPDGFVYDTEPASRAVIAVSEIKPDCTLPYFKEVQQAFYVQQKDVTDTTVLTALAEHFSIKPEDFNRQFISEDAKNKTLSHFQHTRQAEVRGFPTLVISAGKAFKMLTHGYRAYDEIRQDIDNWLNENNLNITSDD